MNKNVNIILNNSNNSKPQNNEEINKIKIFKKDNINSEKIENEELIENKIDNTHKIEEEINKEFFNNSPKIYFFIKIFLLFEGQIIRIFIQLGDFYFSLIITNIYFEIILIQVCASGVSGIFIKIYAFISALIFCFLMKIIITIAYWELYQLKWFELNPFESITNIFNLKFRNYIIRNIYYVTNIFFGIIFWLFIIGLLTMSLNNCKFFDAINLIIFIIIPFLKFIILYLSYCYICIKNLILNGDNDKNEENEDNPFRYWIKLNNLIDKGIIKIGNVPPQDISKGNEINFFEKLFCRNIIFKLKICKEKIIKFSLKTSLEIFFALLSFIYIIYLLSSKGATVSSVFFLLFIYLISLLITIQFPTPFWLLNSIYRWYLKFKKRYDTKYQIKCRKFNEKFGAFKVLDSLPIILSIFLLIVFLFTIIFFSITGSFFTNVEDKINVEGKFKNTNWPQKTFSGKDNIENAICFTKVHDLSIFKIASLSFASYMRDTENIKNFYENSFFKETTEAITEMKYLNADSEYSVVLMVNIDISGKKPLTIFSIQASIKKLDFWLDLEIFCSSLFFTITRLLSINGLESLTSKAIIWILSIPIRILEKFTLFNKYIKYLIKDIDIEIEKIKDTRNIIFTGHSLGGGLAKYLGLKYHKENVAVSGPGITPLEYKFKKDKNYYKYFKSNFIDIIPDNDIVPRIETSGGVRYRVLCEKGFISCHQIDRILCQIGATCRREDLSGDMCMSIFGKKSYQEIRDLAGLKSTIPDDY